MGEKKPCQKLSPGQVLPPTSCLGMAALAALLAALRWHLGMEPVILCSQPWVGGLHVPEAKRMLMPRAAAFMNSVFTRFM